MPLRHTCTLISYILALQALHSSQHQLFLSHLLSVSCLIANFTHNWYQPPSCMPSEIGIRFWEWISVYFHGWENVEASALASSVSMSFSYAGISIYTRGSSARFLWRCTRPCGCSDWFLDDNSESVAALNACCWVLLFTEFACNKMRTFFESMESEFSWAAIPVDLIQNYPLILGTKKLLRSFLAMILT